MDHKDLPDPALFHDRMDMQLRFNDIDMLGHVNNNIYFAFFDLAKTHWFMHALHRGMELGKIETVIANIECAFLRPVHFHDNVEVLTRCTAIHEKSYRLQQMVRNRDNGTPCALCETVMVCFDPATGKTHTVPEEWVEAAEKFEGRTLQQPKRQ